MSEAHTNEAHILLKRARLNAPENIYIYVYRNVHLTLPMPRLLSSQAQGRKDIKSFKPCHVGIHWKALIVYCQMSTLMPGNQSFFRGFFVLAKLTTTSIRG